MSEIVKPGATDVTVYVSIVEDAGGTNPGEPKTGLTNTDITSASFVRSRGLRVAITTSDLAAADSAHSNGGFKEVDATNFAGLYRLDLPDTAVATGVDQVTIGILLAGAANALMAPLTIDLEGASAMVNAEVVDALSVDTIAELAQATPAATPTIVTALMLLYMALRNKLTTDASEMKIFNDGGVTIAKSSLSDNGTVFTRDEMVSGP